MISGVTHDNDGRVVQRLSVFTKVSIELPPNGDCNHPTKLDHFLFLRRKKGLSPFRMEHCLAACSGVCFALLKEEPGAWDKAVDIRVNRVE